ncbi:retinal guanylyl cyclase 2-like [Pecten maximus]|uniref:retinal guanylyl cyclase 2-like n=1 Tax=Pecten maximus TaxID=6579 RepID=UPI0014585E3F|nr:retinal guanylyl cyclase 2-like [Pecten maximus]
MLQEVDIYNKLDCSIAISSNETSLRSTYNNAIMQGINNIRAHNIVLGFRGVKVITPQEWNFLFSLGQNTRIFPNKDLVDMHENSSQNFMTCKEIEFELTSIINNVMALSEGLFSSLTNRINEEHSDAIKKIVIYTMLFLSCVVLFGIVCVLHHFTVNRLLALGVVEDRLNKQLMEEQDRISVILLDVVPPEYIQLVMNGTDKVCTSVKRKIQDKNNKNSNKISLKSSFESLVKTLKKSSVQPTISTISTEDEKHTKRYDGVPINVPILKCVKPDVTFGTLDSATLFMCDFIHLNDLVAVYEPDQLINLVTCLIQILEERTKLYDVHVLCKNINMFSVISGAQSQHALRHVSEIANMALDIRASCSDLEIDALPDSKLRMRISIHVSDCLYKLSSHPEPRFHIYGELVDMTRQLQKNCTANRIHISEDVGTILRQEHQYQIERRGMMICTDGRYLSTQWLLGRRVSVCNPNHHDFRGKNSMPIQLAEKAIYIFDKEKVKYISPYWMTPSGQFNESISMSESSYSDSDGSFNDSQHE